MTGLRKGELASLTVGSLELEGPVARATLKPADEKNRQGASIPLRPDLAADLRAWLMDKLRLRQEEARRAGRPMPVRLPAETPLFRVPTSLLRVLNRDLRAAGIPKQDERGRTVDVHALRRTFGTHLSRGGLFVSLQSDELAPTRGNPRHPGSPSVNLTASTPPPATSAKTRHNCRSRLA